jgi:hypothetical protein
MAVANLANIAEIIKENFKEPFINMVKEDLTMLNFFGTENGEGDGTAWKVHYGRNESVGPYGEEEELGDGDHQKYDSAKVGWALNHALVRVTGLAQAATKSRNAAFFEELGRELKRATPDLKDELNEQMLLTTRRVGNAPVNAPGLDSLGYIVDDGTINGASTTYATISRTASYWQPLILDNGNVDRPLTIEMLQQVAIEMRRPTRKSKQDAIITADVHLYQYGNQLEDRRRYVNTMTLDGGFTAVAFEGKKIVAIPEMPAGDIYFLDKGSFKYVVLLDFDVEEKDVNFDANRFHIKTYSQLVCYALGKQARITDLETV